METTGRRGEFELIARYLAPLAAGAPGALGLLDDAALVTPAAGEDLVVTTDAMVEGVHFPAGEAADSVGRRLLAAGLSDLAAMGARAFAYTIALAIPSAWDEAMRERWIAGFAAGLDRAQQAYAVQLIGGDTVATPGPLWLSLTALGGIARGAALRRSTASPGDTVWVSGSIGDAALGLRAVRGELVMATAPDRRALVERFRHPQPRLELGRRLVGVAAAAADISDGLVADLGHICIASAVTATIETARIPLSPAAAAQIARDPGLWAAVVSGGDDYELVFTAPPGAAEAVRNAAALARTAVSEIGRISGPAGGEGGRRVRVMGPDGRELAVARQGYRHF
jgi:thiamine-monophosphate kinase